MSDLAYWIALSQLPGVGPATFRSLRGRFGTVRAVFDAPAKELQRVRRLRAETLAALRDRPARLAAARRTLKRLTAAGFTLVVPQDERYPTSLNDLTDAPPLLYVRGRLPGPEEPTLSVAGSTRPSRRGLDIARAAGAALAEAGRTVVSGYARGIDSAAHLGALEAGGRTVLVLPMGVSAFALRPDFERFRREVGRRLVIVSECPPDQPWSSQHAVRRDRLIAALGEALLVIEARPDSGTMITFRHATRLGRPAYVVTHRRAPPGAAGNKLAIRRGGLPVTSLAALKTIARSNPLPRSVPAARQGRLF